MDTEALRRASTLGFARASGPGGQHVNKANTAVVLRFDPALAGIEGEQLERLRRLAGRRCSQGGIVVQASCHRSQARNRAEAESRILRLVAESAREPGRRMERQEPSEAERGRRLRDKRRRAALKRSRRGLD